VVTLLRWLKLRDDIVNRAETTLASLPKAAAIEMGIEAKRIVKVPRNRGYEYISTHDLITTHKST